MTYYQSAQEEYYYSDNEQQNDLDEEEIQKEKDNQFEQDYTTAEKLLEQFKEIANKMGNPTMLDGISTTTLYRMTKQCVFETEEDLDEHLDDDEYNTTLVMTTHDRPRRNENNQCIMPSPTNITVKEFEDSNQKWTNLNSRMIVMGEGDIKLPTENTYSRNCFGKTQRAKFEKIKAAHDFKDRMFRQMDVQDTLKRKMTLQLKELEEKRGAMKSTTDELLNQYIGAPSPIFVKR